VVDATTAARNAPHSSCPSIAMLTMPDRSHSTPDIAPNTSGTDSARPPATSSVSGMIVGRPAPTHVRKAMTRAKMLIACR
jgi:hypothetical protein